MYGLMCTVGGMQHKTDVVFFKSFRLFKLLYLLFIYLIHFHMLVVIMLIRTLYADKHSIISDDSRDMFIRFQDRHVRFMDVHFIFIQTRVSNSFLCAK